MKFIFQILFTLIILLVSIWLLMFLPTPSDLIQGSGLGGIVLFPLAIAFYVSVVGIIGVIAWSLISFIFQKQQDEEDSASDVKKKKTSLIFSAFKMGSVLVFGSFATAIAFVAIFMYVLKWDSDTREFKSYSIHYETEDYNDSRIKYYVRQLDESSQEIIQSDTLYNDVVAKMKIQISLGCITYFRRKIDVSVKNYGDTQIDNFRRNSRNQFTVTKEQIKKSIKQEKDLMNKGFAPHYTTVRKESCEEEVPVKIIFTEVMHSYIKGQEKQLAQLISSADRYHSDNKFLAIQKKQKWIKTLYDKNPKYLKE